jgi:hypothetical protein
MPSDEPGDSSLSYLLPKHVRFARSLALVAGAAIGIAAGAAVVGSAGCDSSHNCNGFCGVLAPTPMDAGRDTRSDSGVDSGHANDSDHKNAAFDGSNGGGPRPAPLLPREWLG